MRASLENLDYNRILVMLPIGLIGFMLPQVLGEGFYADPPKNKLGIKVCPRCLQRFNYDQRYYTPN